MKAAEKQCLMALEKACLQLSSQWLRSAECSISVQQLLYLVES